MDEDVSDAEVIAPPEAAAHSAETGGGPRASGGPLEAPIDGLWLRFVVLGVLLVAVELWCRRHLGGSFKSLYAVALVLPIACLLGAMYTLVHGEKRWKTILATGVVSILRWPTLVAFLALVLVGYAFCTSVRIDARSVGATAHVQLVIGQPWSVTREAPTSADEVLLMNWLRTLPWGVPATVEIEGYEAYPFKLDAWWGEDLAVSDMTVRPTLFVRVPVGEHPQLGGGQIELWTTEGRHLATVETGESTGLARFGPPRPVTGELEERWRRELRELRKHRREGIDDMWIDQVLSKWTTPCIAEMTDPLEVGMELAAVFRVNTKVRACATLTLTTDMINDIELTRPTEATQPCDSIAK